MVWRGPGVVQIGIEPAHGLMLSGLTAAEEYLVAVLADGIMAVDFHQRARARGLTPTRVEELLSALREAHVLETSSSPPMSLPRRHQRLLQGDASVWSVLRHDGDGWSTITQRHGSVVEIQGLGRTGFHIAYGLAMAGVGTVIPNDGTLLEENQASAAHWLSTMGVGHNRDDLADPSSALKRTHARKNPPSRAAMTKKWLNSVFPEVATTSDQRPDVVVLVDQAVADPVKAIPLMQSDQAHLSVVIRETDLVVGPLVRPGATPCLRCLDLHRTDMDDAWPRVAAQVAGSSWTMMRQEETVLSLAGASIAVAHVLSEIDGEHPPSVGATIELSLPSATIERHVWARHPECGCTWSPNT